ncbi:hypothetical protein G3M48_002331, partial [Beauveria asiatica]
LLALLPETYREESGDLPAVAQHVTACVEEELDLRRLTSVHGCSGSPHVLYPSKVFKDLKAHILTHLTERPEKCQSHNSPWRCANATKLPGKKITEYAPDATVKRSTCFSMPSRGLTHCRGSVTAIGKTRGRKNPKDYPSSWGFDKCQMTLKKRIMAIFASMAGVRLKLSEGTAYVTDLVVQTMKRAECFLNATEDEKGPWISDNLTE